jgi:hypothetical protein
VAVVFVLTSIIGLTVFQLSAGKADLPENVEEPQGEETV